jgi:hypothetical protein
MLDFDPSKRPSFDTLRSKLNKFEAPLDKLPNFRPPSITEEEQSKRYIEIIEKMVGVMLNRSNYLINILRVFHHFQEEKSELIPKVYKIILLHLSLSLYCRLSEDCLFQMDRKNEFII